MGGRDAGDIAIWSGLSGGAEAIVIPEEPCDLHAIVADLKSGFSKGKNQGLIVLAEGVMSADEFIEEITAIDDSFDIRGAVLGHIQRGGTPTVRDRVLGSSFGVKAVELLNEGASGECVATVDEKMTSNSFDDVFNKLKHKPNLHLYDINKFIN